MYTKYLKSFNERLFLMFTVPDPDSLPNSIKVTSICCDKSNTTCQDGISEWPVGKQIEFTLNGIGYYVNDDENIVLLPSL